MADEATGSGLEYDWGQPFETLLVRLRRAARLTQEQLADRAGLSVRAISSLECGARSPRRFTVDRLAVGLCLPPRERQMLVDAATRHRWRVEIPADPPSAPMFGRDAELTEVRAFLAGDGPALLCYEGEPGIGKSRLLTAAAAVAAEAGIPVLAAACRRGGGGYTPVDDAMAGLVERMAEPALTATLRECQGLELLLPELSDRLVSAGCPSPDQRRRLAFDATARLLDAVAGPGRIVLVLDDMQWAGPRAADLLVHLIRRGGNRLRVVATHRAGDVPRAGRVAQCAADLARLGSLRHRRLRPLHAGDAARLAATIAGDALAGPASHDVVRRAGGLPLFVVELARAAAAGSWQASVPVPGHLRLAVHQQIVELPDPAPTLLRRLAVSAVTVPVERLVTEPTSVEHALDALEAAVCRGVLDETRRGFRFRYPLVREIVADGLGPARRRLWRQTVT